MVNTTGSSSLAQNNLNEAEKRRKYSVERAKATHLSRQLQMRLQYARLKVEHGWQKQNLNEVENLYFHHSHQRGPKPYPSPSLLATTTQPSDTDSFSSSQATQVQSSLSFKLGTYNIPHTSDPPAPPSLSGSAAASSKSATRSIPSSSTLPEQAPNIPETNPNTYTQDLNTLIIMPDHIPEARKVSTPTPPISHPDPTSTSFTIHNSQSSAIQLSTPIIIVDPSPRDDQSASAARGRSSKPQPNARIHSTLGPEDFQEFSNPGSTTSTYDSFWSSHSGWTTSRPFRTDSQGPNEFVGGFESSFSVNTGALHKIPAAGPRP